MPRGKKTVQQPKGLKCYHCGGTKITSKGLFWKCKSCNKKFIKNRVRLVGRPIITCSICGKTRKHFAKGKCQPCYDKEYNQTYYKETTKYVGKITCTCGRKGAIYKHTRENTKTGWISNTFQINHCLHNKALYKKLRKSGKGTNEAGKMAQKQSYCRMATVQEVINWGYSP